MFHPMLAETADEKDFKFPLYASPKLDGLRGLVHANGLRSRSMKLFANLATAQFFDHPALVGFDGELIVGSPTAKDCFIKSTSGLRNTQFDPKATYCVFDLHNHLGTYVERLDELKKRVAGLPEEFRNRVVVLDQMWINDLPELLAYEKAALEMGFEGVITRNPNSRYFNGRSSVASGTMLKLKRFTDSEGELLAIIEQCANNNPIKINELGNSERASNKEGMSKKGTTGAMLLRDLKSGVIFSVGTGFNDIQRKHWWERRTGDAKIFEWETPLPNGQKVKDKVIGWQPAKPAIIKYKYFAIGYEAQPRFPVYLGERLRADLS